jgi:Tfp pilus assembly protein PilE
LIEIMVVLTIMAVLVSMSAPSFSRSVEQSHADIAAANLRAIWNAQRIHWLDNRTYADSIADLVNLGLLDPVLASDNGRYSYAISYADSETFNASATRKANVRWSGQLLIDEGGNVVGSITGNNSVEIFPGFL